MIERERTVQCQQRGRRGRLMGVDKTDIGRRELILRMAVAIFEARLVTVDLAEKFVANLKVSRKGGAECVEMFIPIAIGCGDSGDQDIEPLLENSGER